MTADEKLLLIDNIDEWMEKYPQLRASVTSWEDAPVKDFDEGLLLCSCLRKAHSFIGSAYLFNAKKCLDMINDTLKEIVRIVRPGGRERRKRSKPKSSRPTFRKRNNPMKTETW